MIEINDANFKEKVLESEDLMIVKFHAEWCGPCKVLNQVLEVIENSLPDNVKIVAVNVDFNPETSQEYGIRNIPAVLFFKNGEIVDRQIGSTSRGVFEAKIKALS